METQTENNGGNGGGVAIATASEYPDHLRELGDRLATLTYNGAKELREYLRDEYGIEAPGGDSEPTTDKKDDDKEEIVAQSTFDVVLTSFGEKKINVIKVVRTLTGLGIKEAKELVEAAPKTIKEGLPKEEAEKLKIEIEKEGGTVELK